MNPNQVEAAIKLLEKDSPVALVKILTGFGDDTQQTNSAILSSDDLKAKVQKWMIEVQYNYAIYCYGGLGVVQDKAEAVKWFRKAAESGHAGAEEIMGGFYLDGTDSISKNLGEALKWYHKAAEQGLTNSQVRLAKYYADDDKDPSEAVKWADKAASLRDLGYE